MQYGIDLLGIVSDGSHTSTELFALLDRVRSVGYIPGSAYASSSAEKKFREELTTGLVQGQRVAMGHRVNQDPSRYILVVAGALAAARSWLDLICAAEDMSGRDSRIIHLKPMQLGPGVAPLLETVTNFSKLFMPYTSAEFAIIKEHERHRAGKHSIRTV